MTSEHALRRLLVRGDLDLPHPGDGRTALRHAALLSIARTDVSLARLAEAHADAVAILTDAGRTPVQNALYGVWASESPDQLVAMTSTLSGPVLNGTKSFCTGAGIIDRALVTVAEPARLLVDVDLRGRTIDFDHSGWVAPAFAGTRTATTTFLAVAVGDDDVIGCDGWYLDRPGFWHGACGPAACWAGGAIGLIDHARGGIGDNAHALSHLGALEAAEWAMRAMLAVAGDEIDAHPCDVGAARQRALKLRHLIEQHVTDVVARFGRALGPRPLAFDADIIRRAAEVQLYVRQHGGDRDLEALGASVKEH